MATAAAAAVVGTIAAAPTAFAAIPAAGQSTNEAHIAFNTDESFLGLDTDSQLDTYQRSGGALSLASQGPNGFNGAFDVDPIGFNFILIFNSGASIFFTAEALVSADTDAEIDIYERLGATTTLISQGPNAFNGANEAVFVTMTADGTQVFFDTADQLVSADTDSSLDFYRRAGGVTTLLSQGQLNGNGAFDVSGVGPDDSGSRAWFSTAEQLVSADTDASDDIYERSGNTTTLVSQGQINGNGAFDASGPVGTSADGSRVFFRTAEQLVSADTDSSFDIYERSGNTTTLISQGPNSFNGAFDVGTTRVSLDGSRVILTTAEQLVAADTDASNDIYERSGGTTTLVSQGQINGNGAFAATLRRTTADMTRVLFTSTEQLVAADTDTSNDIYERSGGTTSLVSQGPNGFNGLFGVTLNAVTTAGGRAIFTTQEPLVAADTDTSADLYERSGNTTTLVSQGQVNGNGAFSAVFAALGPTQTLFTSDEQLISTDTDANTDLYARSGGTTRLVSAAKASPPAPTLSGPPSGPVNGNNAVVQGSAEALSTVRVFTNPGCTGAPVATGSAASFGTPGFTISVPDDSTTAFAVTATDANNNQGACSAPRTYVEDSTALPPSLTATKPSSPANDNAPRVLGSAEAGSGVQLYNNSLCVGAPVGVGTAADLASPGIAVSAPDNFSSVIFGKIVDQALNTSSCSSSSVGYLEDSAAPETTIGAGPKKKTKDRTPTLRFDSSEAGSTFVCKVDSGAATSCVSPFTTKKLKFGKHTISVTASDGAANADSTPALRKFKVIRKPKR